MFRLQSRKGGQRGKESTGVQELGLRASYWETMAHRIGWCKKIYETSWGWRGV